MQLQVASRCRCSAHSSINDLRRPAFSKLRSIGRDTLGSGLPTTDAPIATPKWTSTSTHLSEPGRVIWSLESLVRNQKHGTRSSIGEQQEAMDGREVTMWFRLSDSSCWLTRILPGRLSAESSQAASHCAISSLPGLLGSRKGNHLSGLTKQQAAVTTNSSLAHWQMDFYRQLSTPAASWRIDRLSPLAA